MYACVINSAPLFYSISYLGLRRIANQLRGNLTLCPNGRQLVSDAQFCRDSNHCLRNLRIQNCSSGNVLCRTEDKRKLNLLQRSLLTTGIETCLHGERNWINFHYRFLAWPLFWFQWSNLVVSLFIGLIVCCYFSVQQSFVQGTEQKCIFSFAQYHSIEWTRLKLQQNILLGQ